MRWAPDSSGVGGRGWDARLAEAGRGHPTPPTCSSGPNDPAQPGTAPAPAVREHQNREGTGPARAGFPAHHACPEPGLSRGQPGGAGAGHACLHPLCSELGAGRSSAQATSLQTPALAERSVKLTLVVHIKKKKKTGWIFLKTFLSVKSMKTRKEVCADPQVAAVTRAEAPRSPARSVHTRGRAFTT